MKKIDFLKIVIGLFLGIVIFSCNKDDASLIISEQLEKQEVVFDINNFLPHNVASKGLFAKDNSESETAMPECLDLDPSYVEVSILGPNETSAIMYTLNLVTLNNKTETEVVKLTPGIYTITDFVVKAANGTLLWAAPVEGSYYEVLWNLTGVDLQFTVPEFNKLMVKIDVLCYRPYDYEKFGFAWFKYAATEIHTICFFGDICTKFYKEFHNEGSSYFGQEFTGYDFPAIFYINIKNSDGKIVNDNSHDEDFVYANSNLSWFGAGAPLCIEYPDQVGVDETFTFEIMLRMPNNTWVLVHTGTFDDSAMSTAGEEGFGGTDGIFDFVVGNCSYDGNDGDFELPAYLPIPKSADMATSWGPQGFDIYEFYMTFSNILPAPITGLFDENVAYRTLCGEEDVNITVPGNYKVEFYSSLDYLSPNTLIPAPYNTYPWGSMNYFANNCEGYTWIERQQAIWYIMNPTGTINGVNNQLAQDALANPNFVPTVGDYACVLVVPLDVATETIPFQLLLMRIDP